MPFIKAATMKTLLLLHLSFQWARTGARTRQAHGIHPVSSSCMPHHAFVASSAHSATRQNALHPHKIPTALSSTIDRPPEETKFNNVIYASDDTVQLLRHELKTRLLNAADDYKTMKSTETTLTSRAQESNEVARADDGDGDRGYVIRLLHKIVRKIWRGDKTSERKALTESQGVLTSDSFRQMTLEVGATGNQVIELAEQLSLLNPTPIPTLGFRNYGGAPPEESKLSGNWKLRFTTAADASFAESKKRGVATTSQEVDAREGTFINVVDFEKGSLKGFRVVVEGEPFSATDIGLTFKAVKILRKSRFPRLFGQFTLRLPSRLIRWFASRNKPEEERSRGPYLRLQYLDDDLRMHTTDSGNWFIQTRLE